MGKLKSGIEKPIRIGDLVILNAEVTYTGRTSMEAEVQVLAENPITGARTHTNTAYLVYVALDDKGRSTPVPPVIVSILVAVMLLVPLAVLLQVASQVVLQEV